MRYLIASNHQNLGIQPNVWWFLQNIRSLFSFFEQFGHTY